MPKTRRKRRSVALLIETSNAYGRGLLDGVVAYQREHEMWSIYVGEQERVVRPPAWLKTWSGDGIIARIETNSVASAVRRAGLPTVDVSAARRIPEIPWVETDDFEVARLAFEHFRERGFQSYAYCGLRDFNWSEWREEHFSNFVREAGHECSVFHSKPRSDRGYFWAREQRRLGAWVQKLRKPVGVMACYDFQGQQLLDVCREVDIAVPEAVAVVGVDNDARLCRLCAPPLSSVVLDTFRAGYTAARLLDEMMSGKTVTNLEVRLPPTGIAQRPSSDIYAIDDEDVANALRTIRNHACDGLTVAELLREIPLSRRKLEHRFAKYVERTPHAEILRVRLERACRLLRETDLPMATIAERTGFSSADYMSVALKRQLGATPRQVRRNIRSADIE